MTGPAQASLGKEQDSEDTTSFTQINGYTHYSLARYPGSCALKAWYKAN